MVTKVYQCAVGNYISTGGARGSTMVYGSVLASSNSSGVCGSSDQVFVDFACPDNPKISYQVMLYSPSTYTVDARLYAYEPSLSTVANDSYILIDSTSIAPSSEPYTGGKTLLSIDNIFNGTKLRVGLNANTTGSSNSTNVTYRVAIKEWY